MRYTGRGRDDLKKKITNQILKGNLLIVWLLERIVFIKRRVSIYTQEVTRVGGGYPTGCARAPVVLFTFVS